MFRLTISSITPSHANPTPGKEIPCSHTNRWKAGYEEKTAATSSSANDEDRRNILNSLAAAAGLLYMYGKYDQASLAKENESQDLGITS